MTMPISKYVEPHLTTDRAAATDVPKGREIQPLEHREAGELMTHEVEQTLTLLDSLSGDDWRQPTACTLWNVHQMTCHLAGEVAGNASWKEFARQYLDLRATRVYRRAGHSILDSLNQLMVDDRAGAPPEAAVAELRHKAPQAIATRQRLPTWLRALRLPLPALGFVRLDYLFDAIYPRDMWMHRLDICLATGKEMIQTPKHDGRIVALVVRDLAFLLERRLPGASVHLDLKGVAGSQWVLGGNAVPAATIEMEATDFMRLASERIKAEEAETLCVIRGDSALTRRVLKQCAVPF